MSKPSRRPVREERKQRREEQKKLRQRQREEGLQPATQTSIPNRKSDLATVEHEKQERQDSVMAHAQVIRSQLPTLLERLSKIPDPRNPKKLRHKLTALLIFGIFTFIFQLASRREANRTMTRPVFKENLLLLFPDLEDLPHHDTLYRLLERIDVSEIETAHLDMFRRLVGKKKFRRYLVDQHYPIAIDGTQKFTRDTAFSDEALRRRVGSGENQFYVFVVEASLSLSNGMVLPLMSEFLSVAEADLPEDSQDCERKAFRRLARRLKKEFPRLPVLVLLDGLYANGPDVQLCLEHNWEFMIVLKDKSLPSVWEEAEGLRQLQTANRRRQLWGDRRQRFWWANEVEYEYDDGVRRRRVVLHVVVCEESWQEVGANNEICDKESRHAWISSAPLSRQNVHERCNLGGRHRWGIETNILVEKRQGYQYEHCFAYDWNVMKGYHYLMRLGHFLNVLACHCKLLGERVLRLGVRGLLDFLRETLTGPWLDPDQVHRKLARSAQLRFV